MDLEKIGTFFLAGAVIDGETDECAENVTVTLTFGDMTRQAKTNNYGNFEFDGLSAGDYQLEFEAANRPKISMAVSLTKEKYLPEIVV